MLSTPVLGSPISCLDGNSLVRPRVETTHRVAIFRNTIILMARTPETINGTPVSDEQVRAWAEEAARGYDVSKLKPRGRPRMGDRVAKVTTLRIDPGLDAALDARAWRDHMSRSDVLRAALRAWLESA